MLVAPDLEQHPLAMALSPTEPLQMGPDTTIGCYPGLYHNFWEDHINTKEASNKVSEPTVAVAIHPGCHTSEMWQLWRPTFELLKEKRVPVLLTTYNQHEHDATLKVLQELRPTVLFEGKNPLASLLVKQTPYEPDHVWASNAFAAGISFS
ncbi:hypothetical protein FHG87_011572 [Trinorchestia longiramus]|nr:hypothetical protein FHG87_011572 [Trinorchestia longiramus]